MTKAVKETSIVYKLLKETSILEIFLLIVKLILPMDIRHLVT
jgi:hypothetical protein